MMPDYLAKLDKHKDWGLLALRVITGLFIMLHGIGKLWGPGAGIGPGMAGWTGYLATLGFGAFFAYAVAIIELVGGAAIILGLRTRCAAAATSVVIIFAIILTKLNTGFLRAELDLLYLAAFITLIFGGGGAYALERFVCPAGKKR